MACNCHLQKKRVGQLRTTLYKLPGYNSRTIIFIKSRICYSELLSSSPKNAAQTPRMATNSWATIEKANGSRSVIHYLLGSISYHPTVFNLKLKQLLPYITKHNLSLALKVSSKDKFLGTYGFHPGFNHLFEAAGNCGHKTDSH